MATNEEKKSSLLIAGWMVSSRFRGKLTSPLGDQAREKSVKIGEDSWIKVLS